MNKPYWGRLSPRRRYLMEFIANADDRYPPLIEHGDFAALSGMGLVEKRTGLRWSHRSGVFVKLTFEGYVMVAPELRKAGQR